MPTYGGTRQQVTQLECSILATRESQRAAQHQLEDAVTAELHALHLLDAARSVQTRCRRQVEELAAAVSSLQDELAALVPKQREANP
jgi:hypothetical protein